MAARSRFLGVLVLASLLLGGAASAQGRARVKVPLADVRLSPSAASEQVTQVLLWEDVEVLQRKGAWASVLVNDQYRTRKGYPGWMSLGDLDLAPDSLAKTPRVTVVYPWIAIRQEPSVDAALLGQAYLSTRLPVVSVAGQGQVEGSAKGMDFPRQIVAGEGWIPVRLSYGGQGWVRERQVELSEQVPSLDDGYLVVNEARKLEGTPYLWGGMTRVGIDCSGLMYVAYRNNGVTLPRDADQQFQVGEPVKPDELLPGDMVFFGEPGDITHVGMYAGKGFFVHASSGSGVMVSELFQGWYKENYRGARRILGPVASDETTVLIPAP